MIIKKKKDFNPIIKDDSESKSVRLYPMITAKDGAPNFAMRLFEIGPGGHTPGHRHDWEHEIYVIEGGGYALGDDRKIDIEKNDFIYVEPLEFHQLQAGENGMRIICVVPNKGHSS
jgi:quercetin dioxygenase-like cupin family protein